MNGATIAKLRAAAHWLTLDVDDAGVKGIAVATELVSRGSIPTPCRYCLPDYLLR